MTRLSVTLAVAILIGSSVGAVTHSAPLAPEAAWELVAENLLAGDFVVLDVRTSAEFSRGHLPLALNLDLYRPDFRDRLAELDRDNTYLVYCRSGARSARATRLMAALGFPRVHDLRGGILAWERAGLPVKSPDRPSIALSPQQASLLLELHRADPALVVIDVRTPREFAGGHIFGAANLDLYAPDLRARLASLPRDVAYLIYCRSGHRSAVAARVMQELGFALIFELEGGILAWEEAGLPLEG